jgi:hypothetical protein
VLLEPVEVEVVEPVADVVPLPVTVTVTVLVLPEPTVDVTVLVLVTVFPLEDEEDPATYPNPPATIAVATTAPPSLAPFDIALLRVILRFITPWTMLSSEFDIPPNTAFVVL